MNAAWVPVQGAETAVTVYDVNTGYTVRQIIQTPDGGVSYEGEHAIAGVPGWAAPIAMSFRGIAGAKTGKVFPTGNRTDRIDGIPVSCIDVAMPTIFLRAEDWGVNGHETKKELDEHPDLIARLLEFRKKAAARMGMGDVGESVIPKIALIAAPRAGGHLCGRYFTPFQCHDAFALSAGFGAAAGSLFEGTLLSKIATLPDPDKKEAAECRFLLEHPAGKMEIGVRVKDEKTIETQLVRTARLLMRGQVAV